MERGERDDVRRSLSEGRGVHRDTPAAPFGDE
ncbi:MAG: hypothetical protein QOK35_1714, partial [Pseudonocardiales bacterium]|nr:hypothetical protein [Pseudonocardiales bacterium]